MLLLIFLSTIPVTRFIHLYLMDKIESRYKQKSLFLMALLRSSMRSLEYYKDLSVELKGGCLHIYEGNFSEHTQEAIEEYRWVFGGMAHKTLYQIKKELDRFGFQYDCGNKDALNYEEAKK